MTTATKRITAISITQPWRMVVAVPSGASSIGSRLALGYRYGGDLAAAVVPAGFICIENAYITTPGAAGTLATPTATGTLRAC